MINKKMVDKVLSDNYSRISDVVKYKYGSDPKEVKNKSVQVHKLLNRAPKSKSYYTEIHCLKDKLDLLLSKMSKVEFLQTEQAI